LEKFDIFEHVKNVAYVNRSPKFTETPPLSITVMA